MDGGRGMLVWTVGAWPGCVAGGLLRRRLYRRRRRRVRQRQRTTARGGVRVCMQGGVDWQAVQHTGAARDGDAGAAGRGPADLAPRRQLPIRCSRRSSRRRACQIGRDQPHH